jgi:hypothetical protein
MKYKNNKKQYRLYHCEKKSFVNFLEYSYKLTFKDFISFF